MASTLYLKSPAGLYTGWRAYGLHWDVRLPSGQYLSTQGWQEQAWSITLLNQPSANPATRAQYRFRVTAADQAGNTTTSVSATTIDARHRAAV